MSPGRSLSGAGALVALLLALLPGAAGAQSLFSGYVFGSPLEMFSQTLAHEQYITRSVSDLMEQAIAEKDHASKIFLEWYVTEQVEEEENDNDIIAQLKLIDGNPQGLMMLDRELAGRMTNVPTDFSKGVDAAMAASGE